MIWMMSLAVKSTLALSVATVAAWTLRRSSASSRHALWSVALVGLLAMPVLAAALPTLELPLLSAPSTEAIGPLEAVAVEIEGSSTAAAAAPPSKLAWRDWVLLVWLAGAGLALSRLALGSALAALAVRRSEPMGGFGWETLLDEVAATLGVQRPVELRVSDAADVPHVWGCLSPVVLFPRASESWPRERKRAILLHELAHVVRHDLLTQTLAYVARALYWPHPLAWWVVSCLRREAECACDDRVLAAGTEAPDYARHLLEAARGLARPAGLLTAAAVAEGTRLGDRVRAVLDDDRNRQPPRRWVAAPACAAVFLAVAVLAAAEPVALTTPGGAAPQDEAGPDRVIAHEPIGCLIAGRIAAMDATVEPTLEGDEIRLYFRPIHVEDERVEYWTGMSGTDGQFEGRLPPPTMAAVRVTYRIEVRGPGGPIARTDEHVAVVAEEESSCPAGARIAPRGPGGVVTVHSHARE